MLFDEYVNALCGGSEEYNNPNDAIHEVQHRAQIQNMEHAHKHEIAKLKDSRETHFWKTQCGLAFISIIFVVYLHFAKSETLGLFSAGNEPFNASLRLVLIFVSLTVASLTASEIQMVHIFCPAIIALWCGLMLLYLNHDLKYGFIGMLPTESLFEMMTERVVELETQLLRVLMGRA